MASYTSACVIYPNHECVIHQCLHYFNVILPCLRHHHLHVLADSIVEDLPLLGNSVELNLLSVENELANHHRLVLRQRARRKQEFLQRPTEFAIFSKMGVK